LKEVLGAFERMLGLGNVRSGGEECPDHAGVVALISLPTV
jgi:hypothetical protein